MIEEKIYKVKLTKTEQKVLDFIMVHKEEACYYTSVELAEAVQVSGATVIRVVNKLGFSRFSQFKKELQTEVMSQRENLSQTQTSPARLQDVKKMGEREILNACMAAQQQNLKDAFLKNG